MIDRRAIATASNITGLPMWGFLVAMLLIIAAWSVWDANEELEQTVEHQYRLMEVEAKRREALISGSLRSIDLMLTNVGNDLKSHPKLTAQEQNGLLRERMRLIPELRNLLLIDANGLIQAEAKEISIGKDVSEREYFRHHREAVGDDHFYIARPFKTYSGLIGTAVTRVLRDDRGQFFGVLGASIDHGFFEQALQIDDSTPGDEAVLINSHGDLISAIPYTEYVGKSLQGGIGFTRHMGSGKRTSRQLNVAKLLSLKKMAVFHNFPDASLGIVIAREYDGVIGNWRGGLVGHIVRFVLMSGVAVFFYWLAYRRQKGLVLAHREILERQAELKNFKAIVSFTDDAVISKSMDGHILTWNRGAEKIFGYSQAEGLGKPMQMLLPADRQHEEEEILARIAKGERIENFDTVRLHKSGRMVDISATISPMFDDAGNVIGVAKIAHDVTAHKAVENRIGFLASHDRLTELPNRDLFYDRLSQAASQARRKRQRFAVFFLDLDGFKTVNDTYGHQVGDMTLKEASRRLQACTRDVDTVARLGGDEFAMVFSEIQISSDMSVVAEKIIKSVSAPMYLKDGSAYSVGISIGIATYPECGGEIDNLMKAADAAMYESKQRGKNCFTFSQQVSTAFSLAGSWVKFDDAHLVGVPLIDQEHQAIGDLLNKLNVALVELLPNQKAQQMLEEILTAVAMHFRTEERLMDELDYPEAVEHKDQHRRLSAEIQYLKQRFVQGGELVVLQWLKDWFFSHIADSDKRFGEFLAAKAPSE